MSAVPEYLVTLDTPSGVAELEVPSMLGPDAAGRRAQLVAYQQRWGDVGEVTVISVEPLDQPTA